MKRTFQPSNLVRKRRHGFRARMATVGGRKVIAARRARGRKAVGLADAHRAARDFLAANAGRRAPDARLRPARPAARRWRSRAMRLGITVTKKIGNAVVRNRMKRRLRALARELLPEAACAGADHVLIGRAGGVERDFAALGELRSAERKALAAKAGAR